MKEIEVKFYVRDLAAIEKRLIELGGRCERSRRLEINMRFDRKNGELVQAARVLRLRHDGKNTVTYKGPGEMVSGIREREEIEFEVDDIEHARALFEALGYKVVFLYEKYRTNYVLGPVEVVLDQTPIGNFIELEGPDSDAIRAIGEQLELDWEKRVTNSYAGLFNVLRYSLGIQTRDMTFDHFGGEKISPRHLGVVPAA